MWSPAVCVSTESTGCCQSTYLHDSVLLSSNYSLSFSGWVNYSRNLVTTLKYCNIPCGCPFLKIFLLLIYFWLSCFACMIYTFRCVSLHRYIYTCACVSSHVFIYSCVYSRSPSWVSPVFGTRSTDLCICGAHTIRIRENRQVINNSTRRLVH